jgi:hypothetical protein
MFNKLQYISQGNTVEEQTRNIHQALDGGCKWIQLRFKTIQLTQLCFSRFMRGIPILSSTIMFISPNKLQQMAFTLD